MDKNASKSKKEEIVEIDIAKLKNFENHPFKVIDKTLDELMNSITESGITTPLVIRPLKDGNYEIVSGHRRKRACELLGITNIPCIVRSLSKDEAIITMVDSNIQREEVLPSERAFAYKMKFEAMKHQGKKLEETSDQVGRKLETSGIIGKKTGDSQTQVKRYIRLTELIPELLEMVDSKRIAFSPAVEISYLYKNEQMMLLKMIEMFDHTPSLSQAQELRRLSKSYELNEDTMEDLMSEEKPNQIPKINISYGRIQHYVPRNVVTPKEVEDYLIKCAIVCQQRGINIEKLDIKIDKPKEVDRDSR
ncbi:MAG: ParB/RepB/Spo0J family partition protein [Bacilli bacterium]|nr:ParB/RepB/Spo0J family partition protein [Bacilli bacterium]